MGTSAFLQLYEELGLQWKTARFANLADPVPLVPRESDGFVHVGQLCPLGQPAWHQASILSTCSNQPQATFFSRLFFAFQVSVASHSLQGPGSYLNTLHDATGAPPLQAGMVGRRLTSCGAVGASVGAVALAAKEEIKTELVLVRQDMAVLVEGMRAAEQRLRYMVTSVKMWVWLIESQTVCAVLETYGAVLPSWDAGLPDWVWRVKGIQDKVKNAAAHELLVPNSELAGPMLVMFIHVGLLMVRALKQSGADHEHVHREEEAFMADVKHFLQNKAPWQLGLSSAVQVLRPVVRHLEGTPSWLPAEWMDPTRGLKDLRLLLNDMPFEEWVRKSGDLPAVDAACLGSTQTELRVKLTGDRAPEYMQEPTSSSQPNMFDSSFHFKSFKPQ